MAMLDRAARGLLLTELVPGLWLTFTTCSSGRSR